MFRQLFKIQKRAFFQLKDTKCSFSTIQDKKDGSFLQQIREVIRNKSLNENTETEKINQEIDYYELAKKVQNLSLENKEIAKQLMEIHQTIAKVQEESYRNEDVDLLLKSGKFPRKVFYVFSLKHL